MVPLQCIVSKTHHVLNGSFKLLTFISFFIVFVAFLFHVLFTFSFLLSDLFLYSVVSEVLRQIVGLKYI